MKSCEVALYLIHLPAVSVQSAAPYGGVILVKCRGQLSFSQNEYTFMSISSKPAVSEEDLRITRPRILRMENDTAETTNKYPGQLDTLRHLEGIVCHLLCIFFCVFAKAPRKSPIVLCTISFLSCCPCIEEIDHSDPQTQVLEESVLEHPYRNRKNNLWHSRLDFVFESFVTMPLASE